MNKSSNVVQKAGVGRIFPITVCTDEKSLRSAQSSDLKIDFAKLFAQREVDHAYQIMSGKISQILAGKEMMNWAKQLNTDLEQFLISLKTGPSLSAYFVSTDIGVAPEAAGIRLCVD